MITLFECNKKSTTMDGEQASNCDDVEFQSFFLPFMFDTCILPAVYTAEKNICIWLSWVQPPFTESWREAYSKCRKPTNNNVTRCHILRFIQACVFVDLFLNPSLSIYIYISVDSVRCICFYSKWTITMELNKLLKCFEMKWNERWIFLLQAIDNVSNWR